MLVSLAVAATAQEVTPADRLLNSDPQNLIELLQGNRASVPMTSMGNMERRDVREAPVHVQVITSRQLRASRARDLFEALELVPGLGFVRGADDGLATTVHGMDASEGRFLFLLNGQPLNENDLGDYSLGARIPLANVDRIEVVTGPASSIYGGTAALGVVNVVTRTADMGSESRVDLHTGYSKNALTTAQSIISGASRLSQDQDISYFASHARGHRSNALMQLPDSTWLSLRDSTETMSNAFQLSYGWKGLRAHMTYLDQTSTVSDRPYSIQRRDILVGTTYNRTFSRRFNVQAALNYADQLPGLRFNTTDPQVLATNTGNVRATGKASIGYKPMDWLTLGIGTQYYQQASRFMLRTGPSVYNLNNERHITLSDASVHGSLAINTKMGSLHALYQIEDNNLAGSFQAPQLAYIYAHGPVHAKVIWSRGYRIPALMNLDMAVPDVPLLAEGTDSKDFEAGLRLANGLNLTINAFHTALVDPIMATRNDPDGRAYVNGPASATEGLDVRLSFENKKLLVLAAFGKQHPKTDPGQTVKEPMANYFTFPTLPANRGYLVVAYDILAGLTVRGNAHWQDRTTSFMINQAGTLEAMEWPQELVFTGGISFSPGKLPRLSIDLDCRNITDVKRTLVGINETIAPFVLNGREFALALAYKLNQ